MNTVYIVYAEDTRNGSELMLTPFYSSQELADDAVKTWLHRDKEDREEFWEYIISPVTVI